MAQKGESVQISRGMVAGNDGATRALRLHLEDLNTQLRLLPLNSRLRGPLITTIRDVEDHLGWIEGL